MEHIFIQISRSEDNLISLQGWPFSEATEVWIMPSTSGAAPMTNEQRFGPWRTLKARLDELAPVNSCRRCAAVKTEAG